MKKRFAIDGFLLMLLVFLLASCMKDRITHTYTTKMYTPVYESLSQARLNVKSGPAMQVSTPGKICVQGNIIFLNDLDKGVHVIDNTNPAQPRKIAFINIPGNEDIAVKGSVLYADSYGDLVSFDISNPANAVAKNFVTNAFPDRSNYMFGNYYLADLTSNPDSVQVVVRWIEKDTTITDNIGYRPTYPLLVSGCPNCSQFASPSFAAPNAAATTNGAVNGATARFSVVNNYLYTVGYSNLSSFNITNGLHPSFSNTVQVDYHVETIFPFKDKLFVGTNNGVYLYNISASPAQPSLISQFTHVRGCDPVIADNNYAYVTLNDSSACLGFANELQILNIQDISNPVLVQTYQFTHPDGLAKDDNLLFICDGNDGLKIFNGGGADKLQLLKQFKGGYMFDVVAQNGLAIVCAADGLYEYDYSDVSNIHQISKL